jgi:hypothetical protein
MLILDQTPGAGQLQEVFREVDSELAALERKITAAATLPLAPTIEHAIMLVKRLLIACIADEGKKRIPDAAAEDILDVFKVLVKGEPTWNAIRDNCRELVYYRNCINMGREDALPAVAEKMAVRTARHVYLYVKTRCIRDGRLQS